MQSTNFEFLRPRWPELANIGAFAERYMHSDPAGSLGKARLFTEQCLAWVCLALKIKFPVGVEPRLWDYIERVACEPNILSKALCDKLHFIRLAGNKGTHGNPVNSDLAKQCLSELFDIACWLYVSTGGDKGDLPPFICRGVDMPAFLPLSMVLRTESWPSSLARPESAAARSSAACTVFSSALPPATRPNKAQAAWNNVWLRVPLGEQATFLHSLAMAAST